MSDIHDKAQGYLSRCLKALYPNVKPLPDLLGVCTQIDNVLAGQQAEIERLRAALKQARRDAREQVARYHDLMAKMAGSLTELQRRSSWVHNESAKAIRSGIDIRVLGEKE